MNNFECILILFLTRIMVSIHYYTVKFTVSTAKCRSASVTIAHKSGTTLECNIKSSPRAIPKTPNTATSLRHRNDEDNYLVTSNVF